MPRGTLARLEKHVAIIVALLYLVLLTFAEVAVATRSGSSMSSGPIDRVTTSDITASTDNMSGAPSKKISVIFSDLDGTLIHYPEQPGEANDKVLRLPPSSTGMQGVVSHDTFRLLQQLRSSGGVRLVLVSGMRTTTLLKRLPYLPQADVYCCESGGRIFWPCDEPGRDDRAFTPKAVRGIDGRTFSLMEDLAWRQQLSQTQTAGPDGYAGAEIVVPRDGDNEPVVAVCRRRGAVWTFAQELEQRGLVLDAKGYATCFRVNRQQQLDQASEAAFDDLLAGRIVVPPGLSTSTNLGCVDVYPAMSGKRNCCVYVASLLQRPSSAWDLDNARRPIQLDHDCVCLCDDDNDLEMALACRHAFLPAITSQSVAATVRQHPEHFTVCATDAVRETAATEAALRLIVEQVTSFANLRP